MTAVKIKWLTVLIFTLPLIYLLKTSGMPIEQGQQKSLEKVRSPEEIFNPHFTGKDCDTCHEVTPKPGDRDLRLKFGGDDVAMCNSCHQAERIKGDIHPVDIAPPESGVIRVPHELPLYNGKITCRTCHDVYAQCQEKPSIKFKNINFLWGAPYQRTIDFCFRCHNIKDYKKINPHEQRDAEGNILTKQCLYCHQSLPDPDTVSGIGEVTFKTETSTFCAACHGEEETLHPANANHITTPSPEMLKAIETAEKKFNVILPLFKGEIFCGTCHNPHDKGIIKRKEASKGSDTEHRVRLDWSYDLCVACHSEKEDLLTRTVTVNITDSDLLIPSKSEGIPSYHKAFLEKKCRACHRITRETPERPTVYTMCFQTDCHDASLVGKTFKHGEALTGNCLLCHSQHGSQYGAHIVNDQEKLCKACHPLLTEIEGAQQKEGKEEDFHGYYLALFRKLVPDQKPSCSYCHGEDHSKGIYEKGMVSCYQCHNYIKNLIKGKRGKPKNIHDTFTRFFVRNNCTLCHDPHSSPYPHLLKEEPKSYK